MRKFWILGLALMFLLTTAVGALAENPDMDIVDTAIAAEDFDTLVTAVIVADLVEALKGDGPFTVFAPTDAAFAALPEAVLEKLLDNPSMLAKVLLYHVVSGQVLAADVVGLDGTSVATLQGQEVDISVDAGTVFVNDAEVIATDILCTNGVIHVIDTVIIPEWDIVETAILNEDFNTLEAALGIAELVEALQGDGPFTVFAPTDAAFDAIPADVMTKLLSNPDLLAKVLLYHVVAGEVMAADVVGLDGTSVATLQGQEVAIRVEAGSVFVNDAEVIVTDIVCTNGVIHVIDTVIIPEWDIVETAILNADFNTLVAAVVAADLVDALKGDGPFTVFAPTDAAFAALPAGLLDELLANPAALADILLYHVVAGEVLAADVVTLDGQEVQTLLGETVTVTVTDGNVFINDAQVIVTDVACQNGVIHVLNSVLVPAVDEDDDVAPELPRTGGSFAGSALMGMFSAGMGIYLLRRKQK